MKFHPRWAVTVLFVVALGASAGANAALVSRLGGLAYYDTALGITWLANANAAVGSAYDTSLPGTGLMDWATANAWAASLTVDGVSGWQLPTTGPVNGSSFNYNLSYNGSTDYGYNISAPGSVYPGSTGSEMAYMFYNTLGNKAFCDTSGSCPQAGWGLTNAGPFSNVQSNLYWSGTVYAPNTNNAWDFYFDKGYQDATVKGLNAYAWAVHPGDVAAVPIPAAAWLFGSGLLGLIGVARRQKTSA
ncbi:MAG: VPLPA-CTERM sorting domain-containing protein [Sulfuricaulis sp.]